MINHIIHCDIIPKLVINDKKLFKILDINAKYYKINKLEIITEKNGKLKEIWIHNAFHPNAINDPNKWDGNIDTSSEIPPEKVKYCVPMYLQDILFNTNDVLKRIVKSIEIINFDNSYFIDFQNIQIGESVNG